MPRGLLGELDNNAGKFESAACFDFGTCRSPAKQLSCRNGVLCVCISDLAIELCDRSAPLVVVNCTQLFVDQLQETVFGRQVLERVHGGLIPMANKSSS